MSALHFRLNAPSDLATVSSRHALSARMAHLTITEDGIASLREDVARRMEATKQFSPEIAQEFAKLLTSAGPNLDQHGVALWHFMQKETPGGGVNAKKLGVYLQYYYLTTLSYSRARPFSRHLTTVDLCFLIAIASAGMPFTGFYQFFPGTFSS